LQRNRDCQGKVVREKSEACESASLFTFDNEKPPVETKVNLDRRQAYLDQVEITQGLLSE
jgi:hypothetical protein